MSKDDWFRRTTWTETDKHEFEQKYKRARSPSCKAQYLRIQASCLEETGDSELIRAALELLSQYLLEFPEDTQLPWACQQIATCYEKLGMVPEAILAYERSFAAQDKYKNWISHVEICFARFVIANDLVNLFEKAERHLLTYQLYSSSMKDVVYTHQGCLAVFRHHNGDIESARELAINAINAAHAQHSGFSRHPDIGLVTNRDTILYNRIKSIAEQAC